MIVDIAFVILMIVAIFKGLSKGLIVAIFSFLGFIIGLAAAVKLSSVVAAYLGRHVFTGSRWLPVISFLLVFIVVILLVGWGARLVRKIVDIAMLGWLDRIGGMVLYMIIYTLIFSVLLFFAVKIMWLKASVTRDSVVYSAIAPWGPRVIDHIGNVIPFFKDMFLELEKFFEAVAKKSA